jgi:hypothetical protein
LVQFVVVQLDTPSVMDALLIAWRDAGIGSSPVKLAELLGHGSVAGEQRLQSDELHRL